MSLAEVKEQVLALPLEEQAEPACILVERFRRDDPAYQEMLARLIDDRDPNHWVKWDDLKKKLDQRMRQITEQVIGGLTGLLPRPLAQGMARQVTSQLERLWARHVSVMCRAKP